MQLAHLKYSLIFAEKRFSLNNNWAFSAILCQPSCCRAWFHASSSHSDFGNWPGDEAGTWSSNCDPNGPKWSPLVYGKPEFSYSQNRCFKSFFLHFFFFFSQFYDNLGADCISGQSHPMKCIIGIWDLGDPPPPLGKISISSHR